MNRFLLACVFVFVTLAVAPAANAQTLTTLYNTITEPNDVQGVNSVPIGPSPLGTFRIATPFTPTTSGNASLVSVRARCVIPYPTGTTCQGIGEVSIQADVGGKPSGVSLGTMGFFLTDSTWSQPVLNDCGTLSPKIQLTAGTKYWAVMSAPDEIGWLNWKEAAGPSVLESIDGAPWTPSPNQKTLALRIDAGFDACVPRAETNPTPGTEVADMYVRTGKTTFNTITLQNTGVAPLTWSGLEFTGADASRFGILNQEPGPLAQQFRFPRQIGVGGLTFLYVTCTGGPEERAYRATLKLHTNDPTTPDMEFPVKCVVDNTPPTLSFSVGPPDGKNGWYVKPIPATLSATDPIPPSGEASLVAESTCERSEQRWFTYGGFLSLTMQKEGEFPLDCSARDRAGNTGSAGYGVFKLDTRPPNAIPVFDPEPTEDGWNNTATSVRFECEDPVPGSGVDEPASGGGTVSTETAGTDFTSADCNDIAGNLSTPYTATIRIDMTRPVITSGLTPQPNAAGWNRTDVTITWDCGETGNVQSGIKTDAVPDTAVTQETSGTTFTSGGTCADKAANQALTVGQQVKLDKTDPTTTIGDGPPAATSSRTADITFSGADSRSGVARFECSLDNGAWQTCTSAAHYADLADGPHDVRVRAYDAADNVDASPAQTAWTVDTVPPETTIGGGPDAATSTTTATLTYSGDGGSGTTIAGYECRLDGGTWATCGNQADLTALGDGEHHFEVRAIDAAGNRDATPAEHTWTVDTIAPQTSIDSGPDAITSATTASFTHSGDALGGTAVDGYECRLDDGAWGACTSYAGLADGEHRFEVRAYDRAGNRDATPAARTWTVDTVAPQTSISAGPDAVTSSRTAAFTYNGDALTGTAIARYECRLDDADWGACSSPYGELADGEHRFQVRAVDSAGNRDDSPAEQTWTVDTIAPQTSIDAGPDAVTAARTAAFTYGGDALGGTAIVRYECRLDTGTWDACPPSYTNLAAGEHRFHVRAIDAAGNADADPATQTWTIDLAAPTTTLTNKPDARSRPNVMFEFSATDAGGSTVGSFQCSLDGAGYDTCVSAVIYRDLADGRHTFAVRATDGVGNVESPPVAYEWEVSSLFAADDETATTEDTAVWIDISQNDALVGATITADAHSQAGGTVTGSGEILRYTPPADWSGTDHFGYTATRGADSVSATVTVHVVAVNDPPAFRAGSAIVVDEDSGTYRAPWASAIAAGEPGHVRFIVSTSNRALFSSLPAMSPQGELTFTPAPNAYGTAAALIRLENDAGVARSGRVTITVNPVDDAPTVTVARDVRCGRSNNGTFRLLVHDIDSDASKVTVSGSSTSDRVGLEFGGSANERTVSITRRPGLRRATVTVHLTDGAHDFAIPVRLAVGTNRRDRMRGSAGPDLLFGLGGRDRIAGRGGNDLICGGGGADRLDGGAGDDVVIGGRGNDVVGGGDGNDVVRGDTGADELIGGPGDDILRGGPRADLFAPAPGADTLVDFNEAQGDHR